MFYTVYRVTNQINGKVYIGCHKTKDLDDGYMGSGKYLKFAQDKHGLENFEKEILFIFDNPEEMFDKEAELVTEEFVAEANTYNLKAGGRGGWEYANSIKSKDDRKRVASLGRKAADKSLKIMYGSEFHSVIAEMGRKKLSEILKDNPNYLKDRNTRHFLGKTHSEETKRLIGEKNSANQSGTNNSQYGTRWIHSLTEQRSMKIKKDDPLPDGWNEGRKIKF